MRIALGLLSLLLLSLPASAHEIADRAQCRLSFGNSVRKLTTATAIRIEVCHRKRMKGAIPASVDCNDPSTWSAAGYLDGADGFVRDLARYAAESASCTRGITAPSEVGYASCAAPCDGLPMSTFAEVGDCLQCLGSDQQLFHQAELLGAPPAPADKLARKCQETIGRGIVRYLNKRMNLQHGCQFLKDISDPAFAGLDCSNVDDPAHPYAARSQRARVKLGNQIARRCSTIDLAVVLDSCSGDASGETACVLDALDEWTATLLPAIFPPL